MIKNKNKILVLLIVFTVLFVGINIKVSALGINNKIGIKAEEDINAWMPDKNLQEEIRKALKLNDVSEITKESLSSLQTIMISSKNIQNLKGLEYAINVNFLNASYNQISDLSPLSDLISLNTIYLNMNQISNLSPLSGLKRIERLRLGNNQISDLSPLSGLMSLKFVYAGGNQISDLTPLLSLPSLMTFTIADQNITKEAETIHDSEYRQQLNVKATDGSFVNLTPASNNGIYKGDGVIEWSRLSSGDHNLNSSWDTIIKINNEDTRFNGTIKQKVTVTAENIDAWMPDKNLQEEIRKALKLNDVSEITKESLSSLHIITMDDKNIQNLKGLEYATNIKNISANNNQISDLSPLSSLKSLGFLYLSDNQIRDISPLSGLTLLIQLDLRANQISDLNPLSDLASLANVYLDDNQISDLSPLSDLTSLRFVYLDVNKINDLSPLSSLKRVETLSLRNNQINDLGPLSGLMSLRIIYADTNQISDLSPLSNLTSLIWLTITDQNIIKKTEIIHGSKYQQQLNVKAIDDSFIDLTPANSDGVYKGDGNIEWAGLSLGDHDLDSSWDTVIKINNKNARFNGTIKQKVTVTEE